MGDKRTDSGQFYPGGKVIPRQPTGGGGGADGATFFPSVSPEGVISWTNNQGRENPPQRNIKGPKGDDGTSPRIGENGNWWIGETDTGIPAQGPKGEPGDDGDDGTSPHVGENGNWFVGTHDTGVHAQGPKGEDGAPLDTSMPETEPAEDNHGLTKRGIWSWVKSLVTGKLPVKPLPKYLHALSFDDPYKADAEAWYESLAPDAMGGACSAVRRGGKLYRNYDWPFDNASEFVVRMSAAEGRHASVGVASLGAALSEDEAASGVYTAKFRALPGMTLDGINEKGVVAEINVDGGPKTGWHGTGANAIHILAAVRWVLDHGETAQQAAAYVAANVKQPQGDVNFHFMIADATKTYIVENGVAHDVTDGAKVLTNYALYDEAHAGGGKERYQLLADGADISAVLWTNAYQPGNDWDSDFDSPEQHAEAIRQWAEQGETKEAHRGKTTVGGSPWWQTVHTSVYDFAAKTLKVAVQESDEFFTFAVGGAKVELDDEVTQTSANGVKSSGIWSWVKSLLPSWLTAESEEPRGKTEMRVFEETLTDEWDIVLPDGSTNDRKLLWNISAFPGEWSLYVFDSGSWTLYGHSGPGYTEMSERITDGYYGPGGTFSAVRIKTLEPSETEKLAHTSATSGLAKFGADGELEAATPSSTGGAEADYRDPKDNKCHKTEFTEWTFSGDDFDPTATYEMAFKEIGPASHWELFKNGDHLADSQIGATENDTTVDDFEDYHSENPVNITATRQRVATKDEPFVTFDVVSARVNGVKTLLGTLASGYSTFAEWIASKYTKPTGGIPKTDLASDVQTSLDKADTALQSHQDISGKANRTAFADAYDTAQSYAVGDVVDYNGVVYQCVSATSGGAWDATKWEARKLDDFFKESNSLLNTRITYDRNTTGLKDRAFNALTFDGTEYDLSTALLAVAPTAANQPRDLIIVATATAATTISFTAVTIKGDKPTIDGAGTWLITLTEYASGVWYCRQIKMEDAA